MDNSKNPSSRLPLSGNKSALTLAGLVPSAGISCRPAHAAGGTLRQRAHSMQAVILQGTRREGVRRDTIFF